MSTPRRSTPSLSVPLPSERHRPSRLACSLNFAAAQVSVENVTAGWDVTARLPWRLLQGSAGLFEGDTAGAGVGGELSRRWRASFARTDRWSAMLGYPDGGEDLSGWWGRPWSEGCGSCFGHLHLLEKTT